MKVYLPYRELLLNYEAANLHRATAADLTMANRELEYHQIVSGARPACEICGAQHVKFVPFTNPNFPALRVVRVCQVCEHAKEL